jgi:hypothetical protein
MLLYWVDIINSSKIQIMKAFSIELRNQELIINMDTSGIPKDKIRKLIQQIRLEFLAQKAAINENLDTLAEEINEHWWIQNKDEILKNLKK